MDEKIAYGITKAMIGGLDNLKRFCLRAMRRQSEGHVSNRPRGVLLLSPPGCGKSQSSHRIIEILMGKDLKVVAIRHPIPYGDIAAQNSGSLRFLTSVASRISAGTFSAATA